MARRCGWRLLARLDGENEPSRNDGEARCMDVAAFDGKAQWWRGEVLSMWLMVQAALLHGRVVEVTWLGGFAVSADKSLVV